mgnify:CR=1 FL=1
MTSGRPRLTISLLLATLLLAGGAPALGVDNDGDGLRDGFERRYGATSPELADSDGDGVIDSAEDSDGDRLSDRGEQRYDTDPTNTDTDGDGVSDSAEDDDGDGRSNALEQDQRAVPKDLVPDLRSARADRQPKRRACQAWHGIAIVTTCEFGDRDGETHVVLVGDSHATMYLTPLHRIAKQQGWRLTTMTKSACPGFPGMIGDLQWEIDRGRTCLGWQKRVMARLTKDPADLVIFSHTPAYKLRKTDGRLVSAWRKQGEWRRGLKRAVERLPESTTVLALGGTPRNFKGSPVKCLRANPRDMSKCVSRRQPEEKRIMDQGLQQAAAVTRARFDTLFDQICTYDPCPLVQGEVMMWRDGSHITETFARVLQPSLERILLDALEPPAEDT